MENHLTLTHPEDYQRYYINENVAKNLLGFELEAIRFLYNAFNNKKSGVVLNEELDMNCPLQLSIFIKATLEQTEGNNFRALVTTKKENFLSWCYNIRRFSGTNLSILNEHNVDLVMKKEENHVILIEISQLKYFEKHKNADFDVIIADGFDEYANMRIYHSLSGDFNIAVTHKNFHLQRNPKLVHKVMHWIGWTHKENLTKFKDFNAYDEDCLKNLVDPYQDVWLRLTWNYCGVDQRPSSEETDELKEKIMKWAIEKRLSSPESPPGRKRKSETAGKSQTSKKVRKDEALIENENLSHENINRDTVQLSSDITFQEKTPSKIKETNCEVVLKQVQEVKLVKDCKRNNEDEVVMPESNKRTNEATFCSVSPKNKFRVKKLSEINSLWTTKETALAKSTSAESTSTQSTSIPKVTKFRKHPTIACPNDSSLISEVQSNSLNRNQILKRSKSSGCLIKQNKSSIFERFTKHLNDPRTSLEQIKLNNDEILKQVKEILGSSKSKEKVEQNEGENDKNVSDVVTAETEEEDNSVLLNIIEDNTRNTSDELLTSIYGDAIHDDQIQQNKKQKTSSSEILSLLFDEEDKTETENDVLASFFEKETPQCKQNNKTSSDSIQSSKGGFSRHVSKEEILSSYFDPEETKVETIQAPKVNQLDGNTRAKILSWYFEDSNEAASQLQTETLKETSNVTQTSLSENFKLSF